MSQGPWYCFNCGECCRRIALSRQEYRLISSRLRKKFPKLLNHFQSSVTIHTRNPRFLAIEGECPFRNKEKGLCAIYKIRPYPCRLYVCGRRNEREPLRVKGRYVLNNTERQERDPLFLLQMMVIRDHAMRWGRKYGWNLKGQIPDGDDYV